jgi:hypothetical protein
MNQASSALAMRGLAKPHSRSGECSTGTGRAESVWRLAPDCVGFATSQPSLRALLAPATIARLSFFKTLSQFLE